MSEPLTSPKPLAPPAGLKLDELLQPVARAVLRGAAKGLAFDHGGFEAAELWLLDDATRTLRLAADWRRQGAAAAIDRSGRPLELAPADVAALAGGAVVIEEPAEAEGWALHRPAAAAIGLPVASDATIHGVLWLLRDRPLAIPDEVVELAEVVAGRLALEVERAAAAATQSTPHPQAIAPQAPDPAGAEPTPVVTDPAPLAGEGPSLTGPVAAAAWTRPGLDGLAAAASWELPGGRLVALAAAAIDSPDSTLASQRAAVGWLMEEATRLAPRAADAGILLTLLNRRLIESPLAGEGLAVAAALVDPPEDPVAGLGGTGTWAFAGPAVALGVRAAACESHAGDLVPLGWCEPECAYAPRPFGLEVRERLVLVAGDPRLTSPLVERRLGDVYRAATADAHRAMTAEGCLRRLATGGTDEALAAVALKRN